MIFLEKLKYLGIGIVLMMLSACAGPLLTIEPPETSLVNLVLDEVGIMETSARATLRMENENPEPIHLEGSVHRLYVNGKFFGKALSDEVFTIERLNSIELDVPIRLSNFRALRGTIELIQSGVFDYKIASVYYVSGSRSLKRESTGHLDLNALNQRTFPQ